LHNHHHGSQRVGKGHTQPHAIDPQAGTFDAWLDPDNKEPAKIEELLRTGYVMELKRYPVSKLVNR